MTTSQKDGEQSHENLSHRNQCFPHLCHGRATMPPPLHHQSDTSHQVHGFISAEEKEAEPARTSIRAWCPCLSIMSTSLDK